MIGGGVEDYGDRGVATLVLAPAAIGFGIYGAVVASGEWGYSGWLTLTGMFSAMLGGVLTAMFGTAVIGGWLAGRRRGRESGTVRR